MKILLYFAVTFFCLINVVTAQTSANTKLTAVDNFVRTLGTLSTLNVATIADTLTRKFTEKEDKARAIYFWISNNIALDPKAVKQNDQSKTLPETVVQMRKTTPLGFSLLVQEMCSMAKIRCLSVDGYIKNFPEDINEKADEFNHSWNVLQLGQSPEQWFYVDAAKASGYLDKKMSTFTPYFTSEFFFSDRNLFNLDHYPDNSAWQLGAGGPKNLTDFYALPIFLFASYEFGLGKPKPANGIIKTNTATSVSFSFPFNGKIINSIDLVMGDARKQKKPVPMNFSTSGGMVSFNYQFKTPDEFPITIRINSKDVLAYNVVVEEK